jgi:hypothetical protein
MPLATFHTLEKSIYRLLEGPKDIEGGTPVSDFSGPVEKAHRDLRDHFEWYREGYQFLYPYAERWWEGLIAAEQTGRRSREEALRAAADKTLGGAATAPQYVWFIRTCWLRCDEINKKLPLKQRVAPPVLLLKWLIDASEHDYVQLLTCMLYWPIGLDENGQWC